MINNSFKLIMDKISF